MSETKYYTVVNNFEFLYSELQSHKCLILCDIDETILKFKSLYLNWWSETFDKHFKNTNSYSLSEEYSYMDWIQIINNEKPTHTDSNGFENILKLLHYNDSQLLFITARTPDLHDITLKHLNSVSIKKINNIELNKSHFIYCCTKSKGECIRDYVNLIGYSKIIFIDDLLQNLEDVYEIYNTQIELYKFEITKSDKS